MRTLVLAAGALAQTGEEARPASFLRMVWEIQASREIDKYPVPLSAAEFAALRKIASEASVQVREFTAKARLATLLESIADDGDAGSRSRLAGMQADYTRIVAGHWSRMQSLLGRTRFDALNRFVASGGTLQSSDGRPKRR